MQIGVPTPGADGGGGGRRGKGGEEGGGNGGSGGGDQGGGGDGGGRADDHGSPKTMCAGRQIDDSELSELRPPAEDVPVC